MPQGYTGRFWRQQDPSWQFAPEHKNGSHTSALPTDLSDSRQSEGSQDWQPIAYDFKVRCDGRVILDSLAKDCQPHHQSSNNVKFAAASKLQPVEPCKLKAPVWLKSKNE